MGDPRTSYMNQTLIGNWYEDRLDDAKVGIDPRRLRTGGAGETPIKMRVPRISTDDFYRSSNMEAYTEPPRQRPVPSYNLINRSTLRHTMTDRSVPDQGWTSTIPKHDDNRNLRLLHTTNHSTYGGPYAEKAEQRAFHETLTRRRGTPDTVAGTGGIRPPRGMKGFGATGEQLKIEPQMVNTFVQRSWLYNRELNPQFANALAQEPEDFDERQIAGLKLGRSSEIGMRNFGRNGGTLKADTGIWFG